MALRWKREKQGVPQGFSYRSGGLMIRREIGWSFDRRMKRKPNKRTIGHLFWTLYRNGIAINSFDTLRDAKDCANEIETVLQVLK